MIFKFEFHYIFKIRHCNLLTFNFKGNGIFTELPREMGEFLLEYAGVLMSAEDGEHFGERYAEEGKGCFLYYFKNQSKQNWYVLFQSYNLNVLWTMLNRDKERETHTQKEKKKFLFYKNKNIFMN